MKILFLAYACEPNRGSELGVGWKWPLYLSEDKDKEIFVITRTNNKSKIEDYWKDNICPENLHFFYYDLSKGILWAKKYGMPINIYYALWLQGSSRFAQKLHQQFHFDMAHHITFGVFRDACALYKLHIPYIIGPVGGGETTPISLLPLLTLKERLKEAVRSLANSLSLTSPLLHKNFNKASLILSKTKETKRILRKWNDKILVRLEIGINNVSDELFRKKTNSFLYVGRFTYWKGYKLALMAFQQYAEKHPCSTFTMIGRGNTDDIKSFASNNNLEKQIKIIPWIEQSELKKYYTSSSAMLFPSMHDSSGNVVLEALSFGMPVICLDCGGPSSILGEELVELTVQTKGKNYKNIIDDIVSKMEKLTTNNDFAINVGNKCIDRAKKMLWKETISNTYKEIINRLFEIKK